MLSTTLYNNMTSIKHHHHVYLRTRWHFAKGERTKTSWQLKLDYWLPSVKYLNRWRSMYLLCFPPSYDWVVAPIAFCVYLSRELERTSDVFRLLEIQIRLDFFLYACSLWFWKEPFLSIYFELMQFGQFTRQWQAHFCTLLHC